MILISASQDRCYTMFEGTVLVLRAERKHGRVISKLKFGTYNTEVLI